MGKFCISTCESPLKSLLRPPSLLQGLPRRGSSVSAWIPQGCCWDPHSSLQEITMFTEGWYESVVHPCRNTLWDYYRDVCGFGREGVVLSRAGSTGKGRQQCKEKSATREGLTERNDHVDCVTVPSFSWTQNGNFQVLFMSLRLLENYSWVFKIVF